MTENKYNIYPWEHFNERDLAWPPLFSRWNEESDDRLELNANGDCPTQYTQACPFPSIRSAHHFEALVERRIAVLQREERCKELRSRRPAWGDPAEVALREWQRIVYEIENPDNTICEHCQAYLKKRGLKRHQKTNSCLAAKNRHMQGWTGVLWPHKMPMLVEQPRFDLGDERLGPVRYVEAHPLGGRTNYRHGFEAELIALDDAKIVWVCLLTTYHMRMYNPPRMSWTIFVKDEDLVRAKEVIARVK